VFQNWIERLKWVIRHTGEYFIKWLIKDLLVLPRGRNRRGRAAVITFCTPSIPIWSSQTKRAICITVPKRSSDDRFLAEHFSDVQASNDWAKHLGRFSRSWFWIWS
jgi:hypothetical protein